MVSGYLLEVLLSLLTQELTKQSRKEGGVLKYVMLRYHYFMFFMGTVGEK